MLCAPTLSQMQSHNCVVKQANSVLYGEVTVSGNKGTMRIRYTFAAVDANTVKFLGLFGDLGSGIPCRLSGRGSPLDISKRVTLAWDEPVYCVVEVTVNKLMVLSWEKDYFGERAPNFPMNSYSCKIVKRANSQYYLTVEYVYEDDSKSSSDVRKYAYLLNQPSVGVQRAMEFFFVNGHDIFSKVSLPSNSSTDVVCHKYKISTDGEAFVANDIKTIDFEIEIIGIEKM